MFPLMFELFFHPVDFTFDFFGFLFQGGKVGPFFTMALTIAIVIAITKAVEKLKGFRGAIPIPLLQYFVGCIFQALEVLGEYFLHKTHPPPVALTTSPLRVALLAVAGFPPQRFPSAFLGMTSVAIFILTQFP